MQSLTPVLRTPEQVRVALGMMSEGEREQVSPDWLALVSATSEADPWVHGFSMIHRSTGAVVGECGFKGPPGADGVVEIAYGVKEGCRVNGFATEAARGLVSFAFTTGKVRLVCAHTPASTCPSSRGLAKAGFRHYGEVIHPEDGLVWRFERRAPSA